MIKDVDNTLQKTAACLREITPELEVGEIRSLVKDFIGRKEQFLNICREHGSPLYIIEPEILRERVRQFTSAFRRELPDIDFYYAVKSNNNPEIARILVNNGLGLDVSSGLELVLALDSGADGVVFSGPGKTDEELTLAVQNSDRVTVLMDSFGELDRLQKIAKLHNKSVKAGVRIMTGTHGIWRKFGIPLSDLPRFMELAEKSPHVNLTGLQSHVSWNLDPDRHIEIIKAVGAALGDLPEKHRMGIKFLDIGGGFWPPQGEWLQESGTVAGRIIHSVSERLNPALKHFKCPAVDIEQFASAIGRAVRDCVFPHISCRICVEPGRWLCNDAMHILMKVQDKKADDLVITDAGTNAIGWERFETDYFPVINLSQPGLVEHECMVMGSLCTPHDLWGYSYYGEGIGQDDVLIIPHQGAYTYSLRQEFIKPLPRVVCMEACV